MTCHRSFIQSRPKPFCSGLLSRSPENSQGASSVICRWASANPSASDYAGLALFAVICLAALTLVIAPGTFIPQNTPNGIRLTSDWQETLQAH